MDFLVAACMQDLVPGPGIEPGPPALETQSLTHWTTREVPSSKNLIVLALTFMSLIHFEFNFIYGVR